MLIIEKSFCIHFISITHSFFRIQHAKGKKLKGVIQFWDFVKTQIHFQIGGINVTLKQPILPSLTKWTDETGSIWNNNWNNSQNKFLFNCLFTKPKCNLRWNGAMNWIQFLAFIWNKFQQQFYFQARNRIVSSSQLISSEKISGIRDCKQLSILETNHKRKALLFVEGLLEQHVLLYAEYLISNSFHILMYVENNSVIFNWNQTVTKGISIAGVQLIINYD